MRTTYRLSGSLLGELWWPIGHPAWKTFEYRTDERPDSLAQMAEAVMTREDGDFSSAAHFMADTVLTIIRWRDDGRGHRSRSWYAIELPSLGDFTVPDMPVIECAD